jgi:hypothetical protein
MRFGVNDTPQNLQANVSWLIDIGCDAVRFGIGSPPDAGALWGADQVVNWAISADLRPFIVIGGWNPAPHPDEYASWVDTWVRHYGTRVTYCLWNEPNYRSDAHPNPLSAKEALALNLAGARAARQARRDAKLLGSPIGPTGEWERYFEEVYSELEGLVDVAVHVYPGGAYEDRLDRVRADLDLAARYGDVHVTEMDMAAPWLSDDDSKPALAAKGYELCERRKVRTLILHSIENHRAETDALRAARF